MITKYHNFDNGYIGLVNLTLKNLPKTIEVKGHTLLLKDEHHISMMCVKRVAPFTNLSNQEAVQLQIVEDFKQFIKKYALTEFTLLPEFRFVEREEKKTVIVMVEVPHLEEFFNEIRLKYDTQHVPLQPTHITLYTLQPNAGIGIFSEEELQDSEPVILPELAAIEIES